MTQMMLFDTSASSATAPLPAKSLPSASLPVRSSVAAVSPRNAGVSGHAGRSVSRSRGSLGHGSLGHAEDGIQQMGDLARLVLLRYQLVAKRREEMASRSRG